jgi:hypothetical protein
LAYPLALLHATAAFTDPHWKRFIEERTIITLRIAKIRSIFDCEDQLTALGSIVASLHCVLRIVLLSFHLSDSQNAWCRKGVLSLLSCNKRCCHDPQNALVEIKYYPALCCMQTRCVIHRISVLGCAIPAAVMHKLSESTECSGGVGALRLLPCKLRCCDSQNALVERVCLCCHATQTRCCDSQNALGGCLHPREAPYVMILECSGGRRLCYLRCHHAAAVDDSQNALKVGVCYPALSSMQAVMIHRMLWWEGVLSLHTLPYVKLAAVVIQNALVQEGVYPMHHACKLLS